MQISIRLADFAPPRLLCLAEALKRTFPGRKNIAISIFSSHDAAKRYRVHSGDTVGGPIVDWGSQMHGRYFYDADKHVEYLEISPLGVHSPFTTRIDLPSSNTPQCRLQIASRCLLALEHLSYPRDALKSGISGAVTLTGTIRRDGVLIGARIEKTDPQPVADKDLLDNAALQNLKSWRFEAAQHETAVQVTYIYEIGDPPMHEFELPTRILVRDKLPR